MSISDDVSEERLEVLREAYQYLIENGERRFGGELISRDIETLSIIKELQHCRSMYCPDCHGLGWVQNPDARYEMDYVEHMPTGVYSTIDDEEIDCPRCDGVGFCREIKEPVRLMPTESEDGGPF